MMSEGTSLKTASARRGEVIGGYRVLSHVGSGQQSIVVRAVHLVSAKAVALKLVPWTAQRQGRLRQEAARMHEVGGPGIPRVHGVGRSARHAYLAMDFVEGEALDSTYDLEKRTAVYESLLEVVRHVHRCGYVHGDLKPDQVLIDRSRGEARAWLLDFGASRCIGEAGVWRGRVRPPGKPARGVADPAWDLYALQRMFPRMKVSPLPRAAGGAL